MFDRLHILADQDPRANAWNDTEVMQRLAELGVEMPEPTAPGNPAEPQTGATAPVAAEVPPNPVPQQPVAEGSDDLRSAVLSVLQDIYNGAQAGEDMIDTVADELGDYFQDVKRSKDTTLRQAYQLMSQDGAEAEGNPQMMAQVAKQAIDMLSQQGMAEGDNLATFEDINSLRNLAGLPVVEGVLTDSTGSTLDHICNRFGKEVRDFETSGDMSDDLYHALYDYYFDDMPYGTKKARDGDPYEWIADRFSQDRGLDENLIAPVAMPVATEGAGCNMTTEGEYCPEHGLMECGMGMAEDIMGETLDKPPHDDPMNYNAAITGSYYESKEGDATLARIKSLALLK